MTINQSAKTVLLLEKELDIDTVYLQEDMLELDNFDDLVEVLEDQGFLDVDVIYYYNAMDFLKEHDNSLYESLEIASEYGYKTEDLNSELLASLLATKKRRENLEALREEIEEILN